MALHLIYLRRHPDIGLLRTIFMVDDTLEPYLEKEFSFSLILHELDFPGGVTIIENIIQAVQRSRRMIMLLTRYILTVVKTSEMIKPT